VVGGAVTTTNPPDINLEIDGTIVAYIHTEVSSAEDGLDAKVREVLDGKPAIGGLDLLLKFDGKTTELATYLCNRNGVEEIRLGLLAALFKLRFPEASTDTIMSAIVEAEAVLIGLCPDEEGQSE
jgi:hypothetical protein